MIEFDTKPYLRRLLSLEAERSTWDALAREVSDYLDPHQAFWSAQDQPNRGEKRHSSIIDHSGTRALRVLAAGMQGGLTSPMRPWFRLALEDQDLMEYQAVKNALAASERGMYRMFAQSTFYPGVHKCYRHEAGFGQGVVIAEQDLDRGMRVKVVSPGEYVLAEGPDGMIDTLCRRFWLTARQVVEAFGLDNCNTAVKQAVADEKAPDRWFQVVHCVKPRRSPNPSKGARGKPWESVYFQPEEGERALRVSGYDYKPFMVPRWDTCGSDVYGRSAGHEVLGDVKMLQGMQRNFIKQVELVSTPPLKKPSNMKGVVSLLPGAISEVDAANSEGLTPLYQAKPDLAALSATIEDTRKQIREGLFNDLFLMLVEHPDMTATEVLERKQEKILLLGPVIERQITELLDPLVSWTFNNMYELGLLPPMPREIQGMAVKVDYLSVLAQAQKQLGTEAVRATANFVGALAQLDASVVDKLDLDQAVDEFGEMVGTPAKMIRSDDQVAQLRQARARMQQEARAQEAMAQQLAGVQQVAQTAKTLSETPTGDGNALDALDQYLGGTVQ